MTLEILKEKNAILFDTNIHINLFEKKDMSYEKALKIVNYLYPNRGIKKIIIPDSIYSELELIKKGSGPQNQAARKSFSEIGKYLCKGEILEYVDVERHPQGVDDSIIDLAINNDFILLTFDVRTNIRYSKRLGVTCEMPLIDRLECVNRLVNDLEKSNEKLSLYINTMFDAEIIDSIDFIKASNNERIEKIIDFLIEKNFENENNNFKNALKNSIIETEKIILDDTVLNSILKNLSGYNFGKIKEQSLKEKFNDIIERFLEKNNISSFEELKRRELFSTEEEIVEKILEKTYKEVDKN